MNMEVRKRFLQKIFFYLPFVFYGLLHFLVFEKIEHF